MRTDNAISRAALVFALTGAATAWAGNEEDELHQRLKQLYPATQFTAVHKTPLPEVYEVVMGENIAYVGRDGKHFLFGHLFDMQAQVDLTSQRKAAGAKDRPADVQHGAAARVQPKMDIAQLPLRDAIKRVNGDGSRVLVVFSDPMCPYCRRLEADLPQLKNTTVYTFLIPILGPASRSAAQQEWARAVPERAQDEDVLERNLRLARQYGINGTPMLIRADGQSHAGAMPLQQLDAWLAEPSRTALDRR